MMSSKRLATDDNTSAQRASKNMSSKRDLKELIFVD